MQALREKFRTDTTRLKRAARGVALGLLAAGLVAGCAGNDEEQTQVQNVQMAYEEAREAVDRRNYRRGMLKFRWGANVLGLLTSLGLSAAAVFGLLVSGVIGGPDPVLIGAIGGGFTILLWVLWMTIITRYMAGRKHRKLLASPEQLTPLDNQTRRDSWRAVEDEVREFLKRTGGKFPLNQVSSDYGGIVMVRDSGAQEIREALKELDNIPGESSAATEVAVDDTMVPADIGPALKRA